MSLYVHKEMWVCLRSVTEVMVHNSLTPGILVESFLVLQHSFSAVGFKNAKPSCNFVFLKDKLHVNKIK